MHRPVKERGNRCALVKRIHDLEVFKGRHGVRLHARSKPSEEATFTIEIPILSDDQSVAGQPDLV